jgi:hypothetical protein
MFIFMEDGKSLTHRAHRLDVADCANSDMTSWVRENLEAACSVGSVGNKIRDISAFGYNGKRYKGSTIPSVVWSVSKPHVWFAGDYLNRDVVQVSFRLHKKHASYIARLREFVVDVLPRQIETYSSCFGLLEVERACEIAFGVEPQCGNHEIGHQRRMIQRFWEIELANGKEILPHIAWVNILTGDMCSRAAGSASAVFERCLDIVKKHGRSHAIQVECVELKNGSAVIALLPTYFDTPFGQNDGDFTAAFDSSNDKPLYDIHCWWRKSGLVL